MAQNSQQHAPTQCTLPPVPSPFSTSLTGDDIETECRNDCRLWSGPGGLGNRRWSGALSGTSAGFWLGGSIPPCRLRQRNLGKFDYEMVHSEVYLNKYVVSIAPFSTPACHDCSQNITKHRQGAPLSPSDRAMRLVSSNLANYHATVQKLLIRQVLTKPMV